MKFQAILDSLHNLPTLNDLLEELWPEIQFVQAAPSSQRREEEDEAVLDARFKTSP